MASFNASSVRSFPLWLRDAALGASGYVLVGLVAVAGWSASFVGLHEFAEAQMDFSGRAAWLVPITFDGAALGLTVSVARASLYGNSAVGWRFPVAGFTALSAWINWAHINGTGRWVAALLPVTAVTVFECLMSEARRAFDRRTGRIRVRIHAGIHPLRWLMSPRGTWGIVRARVLEIPPGMSAPMPSSDADVEPSPKKRRTQRREDAAQKIELVQTLLADQPDLSGAAIGARLGLSARQGRRLGKRARAN